MRNHRIIIGNVAEVGLVADGALAGERRGIIVCELSVIRGVVFIIEKETSRVSAQR